uniref:hypothetical protein n=1 Tax=Pararhizobium sp. IMCC3301 TaxID=3067904 RepID=UPI002740D622|nr:hypothetical protein [Pararhizobium sp. IMCC3301]
MFMMVREYASDQVIKRLGEKGGRIIRTNLDTSKEAALRDAFDKTHKQARAFANLYSTTHVAVNNRHRVPSEGEHCNREHGHPNNLPA